MSERSDIWSPSPTDSFGTEIWMITKDRHKRFALDSPELVGGTGVWLATNAAMFLSGRFISANWSVDELVQKKHTILAGNDLKIGYEGKFGLD